MDELVRLKQEILLKIDQFDINQMRSLNRSIASIKRSRKPVSADDVGDDFEELYKLYPVERRNLRKKAFATFKRLISEGEDFAKMMTGLKIDLKCRQWQNWQYVPNITTWLNDKRWLRHDQKSQQNSLDELLADIENQFVFTTDDSSEE